MWLLSGAFSRSSERRAEGSIWVGAGWGLPLRGYQGWISDKARGFLAAQRVQRLWAGTAACSAANALPLLLFSFISWA